MPSRSSGLLPRGSIVIGIEFAQPTAALRQFPSGRRCAGMYRRQAPPRLRKDYRFRCQAHCAESRRAELSGRLTDDWMNLDRGFR